MSDGPDSNSDLTMHVQVVYALPEQQFICDLAMPAGATVQAALERSGFLQRFPTEHPEGAVECAVFGVLATAEQPLNPGDRVEILRPLLADPKVRRRQNVAQSRQAARRRG